MKKVELLAPAGNYEALKGAIAAGADAVYLGGNAFGARAYADNFSQEEICKGIRFAHLFHKKIYLTVNTLVKEKEFTGLYDFLMPFYEAGLDGIIIQDLGVFHFVKKHFPGLSLHVSTQMTITGALGAELIKEAGAERIVPARELSLAEIQNIKDNDEIEIETFVHGAMCYCYSGQCLFSSILGGRSGNRGRCAQPCRLPYTIDGGKEQYLLSMKDMCTISILPQLIDAGIDSFKIEGRMKKPEYAAGVVSIYRKYIDQYYESPENYQVTDEDLNYLKSLYIRSDIMQGYYHKHNGKDMITISSPAYLGSDDKLLAQIRSKYIEQEKLLPVYAYATLKTNCDACLKLVCHDTVVTATGAMVQKAMKQPMSEEKVREQLFKCGNTHFEFKSLKLDMDDDIFMPVSALNQLRRDAIHALEETIIEKNGLSYSQRAALPYQGDLKTPADTISRGSHMSCSNRHSFGTELHVLVGNKEQLQSAATAGVKRIYVDRDAIDEAFLQNLYTYKTAKESNLQFYLAFPYIIRQKDDERLMQLFTLLQKPIFDGALVRNLETLSFLNKNKNQKPIVTDTNLYIFNSNAVSFFSGYGVESYLPIELNKHEVGELSAKVSKEAYKLSGVVYGRIPLMISASCLKKTTKACTHQAGFSRITDRYHKDFPVYTDCVYCYNILYNSVPLSQHNLFQTGKTLPYAVRLDFTTEDGMMTQSVIQYFKELISGRYQDPFYKEFTTGHYKRGVE